MNFILRSMMVPKMVNVPKYSLYIATTKFPTANKDPATTAKRIIKVVGERLRRLDPIRWESIPITFQTHWNDPSGKYCMETCINVHDALEKEFGIDIKDKAFLIQDIPSAFYIVMLHHDSI